MDPSQFHDPPADVVADEAAKKLRGIAASKLILDDHDDSPVDVPVQKMSGGTDKIWKIDPDADPDRMMAAKLMLEAARRRARSPHRIAKAQENVIVSVSPDSGRIRKNGPCPCGSKKKFKKCCLSKVRSGKLERVTHTKGASDATTAQNEKAV